MTYTLQSWVQVIPAVTTVLNEFMQPTQQWPGSKSWSALEPRLMEHAATVEKLKMPPPKVCYVDDVEQSEKILLNCYPSLTGVNGYGMLLTRNTCMCP